MIRVQVQDGAIERLSCAWVILCETQIAQSKERFRIFGHVGVGDSEFFFCERQIVRFQRLPA